MVPSVITSVQVRYSDLDPNNHVNNVAFFALMETARVRFLHGLSGTLRGHMVVARAECDYRREIPGSVREVEVEVSVEKLGTTSFVLLQEIRAAGQLCGVGRTVQVTLGADRRPRPLSEAECASLTDG